MSNVLTTLTLELVRQGQDGKRWETCEGCPARHGLDDFNADTLCSFLSKEAKKVMGGFASCGGGATWRVKA